MQLVVLKKDLLDYASKFDALSGACGEIVNAASAIVERSDYTAAYYLIVRVSEVLKDKGASRNFKLLGDELKNSILKFMGCQVILENQGQQQLEEDTQTLAELLAELDKLVGLTTVKNKVNDLIAFQQVQLKRVASGFQNQKGTMHLAFTGNPGTGKTTVARIVGRVYKQIGLLSKGHFVEVSRTDLIAGYQGQTALKVKKVIEKAKGGVLFIDEAYSITENDHSDSYGRECLTELTKALEDYRDDLVVIVAGYTVPMEKFFRSNPGLKSRFNTFIEFPDYAVEELEAILHSICQTNDYILTEEVKSQIRTYLENVVAEKKRDFANGRLVRNLYEDLIMNHARRVSKLQHLTREDLCTIQVEDFSFQPLEKLELLPNSENGSEEENTSEQE